MIDDGFHAYDVFPGNLTYENKFISWTATILAKFVTQCEMDWNPRDGRYLGPMNGACFGAITEVHISKMWVKKEFGSHIFVSRPNSN
jgi:hypothetical protein